MEIIQQNRASLSIRRKQGEEGFALIITMVIMVILILLGTFALNNTTTEISIAGNDKAVKTDFFNQEASVNEGIFQETTWLNDSYLTADSKVASYPPVPAGAGASYDDEYKDSSGRVLGKFKIRNIVNVNAPVAWDDKDQFGGEGNHPANKFPLMLHRDKPPAMDDNQNDDRAFGQNQVEIRRFVITSYSPDSDKNSVVQQGVFKVFNKF